MTLEDKFAQLEQRITRLEDIESIRQLQSRYQRSIDTRDFDAVGACFTEDVVSRYDSGDMTYTGREAVVGFLSGALTPAITSTHLIHGGEIDIVDPTHATGKWYLEDFLLHSKYLLKLHGAAVYDVCYRKEEGVWRISSIGYERVYEYFERRPLLNLLTLAKRSFLQKKLQ